MNIELLKEDWNLKPPICCKNPEFILSNLIAEMNEEYPIPKDVLSYYVKKIFDNGFMYAEEHTLNQLIRLTESSDNFKDIKFEFEKVKKSKDKHLLFIRLPYKPNIWKDELKKITSQTKEQSRTYLKTSKQQSIDILR